MNSMRTLLFLNTLPLVRRASAWSDSILDLAFSAFFLWMNSMRTLLFLNTLPLAFKYSSWYRWRSIFLWMNSMRTLLFLNTFSTASLYLLSSLLRTLILAIHMPFWLVLASLVPFLLPNPLWRPFRRASSLVRTRDLEWTATGFLMTRPSLISFLMFCLELALAISLISLGSSQTLFFATFHDIGRKALLKFERTHLYGSRLALVEVNQANVRRAQRRQKSKVSLSFALSLLLLLLFLLSLSLSLSLS